VYITVIWNALQTNGIKWFYYTKKATNPLHFKKCKGFVAFLGGYSCFFWKKDLLILLFLLFG
jgi:hypothetical protein